MDYDLHPINAKLYCAWIQSTETPTTTIGDMLLSVQESTKSLGWWWYSQLSLEKHISILKSQCKQALNLTYLRWGGDTLCCTGSPNAPKWSMDALFAQHPIPTYSNWQNHNTGLRLTLDEAVCNYSHLGTLSFAISRSFSGYWVIKFCFCWMASPWDLRCSERVDQLLQTKWEVFILGKDQYLLKPTPVPRRPKKFQYLDRVRRL